MTPRELQDMLEELTASRASRLRAWQNFQEFRWVLKDNAGIELPPPAQRAIDAEGAIIVQGVAKAIKEHRAALADLLHVARALRASADRPPGEHVPGYPQLLHELHRVMDRAEVLLQ